MDSTSSSTDSVAAQDRVVYTLDTINDIPKGPVPYAVLGHPVQHSLSPGFQNAAFEAVGLDAQYVKIDVAPEQLPALVEKMKARGFGGWNITVPLKIEMFKLVDECGDQAEQFGAVNTVLNTDGKLTGFNTDGIGWANAIRDVFAVDVTDMRIMILGAGGGAGRALAKYAALERCERLVLVNRSVDKVIELAKELEPLFSSEKLEGPRDRCVAIGLEEEKISEEIGNTDLLVNTTSLGLKLTDPPILSSRAIEPHLLVYDSIYRPAKTRLLQDAENRGARIANGLGMLLHSGAASFSIWTGRSAPLDVMRQRLGADAAQLT